MSFVKLIRQDGFITKEELKQFLIVLNPMAAFITSELYEEVFGGSILDESWPIYDEKYLQDEEIEMPIQINGKKAKVIKVSSEISQDELVSKVKEQYSELFSGKEIKKVFYVPGKIINIIL